MGLTLQYRWQLIQEKGEDKLVYFGLRNWPNNSHQIIPISPREAEVIRNIANYTPETLTALPGSGEMLARLMDEKIIVPEGDLRQPATRERFQTCTRCINNDLIIPGLEFDDDGVCAFCQCYANNEPPEKSGVHVIDEKALIAAAADNRNSRFDVMVFFTGGKDSSYLLWYLVRKLHLRVLAAFWDMPYTHETARDNIKRVIKRLPEVEFINWELPWSTIKQAMNRQMRAIGLPCLCPSTAFPLFYPLAFRQQIPFIMFGMEDIQAAVMEYVFPAPVKKSGAARPLSNREQTLQFLKTRSILKPLETPLTWMQELVNYHASIRKVIGDQIFSELTTIINQAEADPALQIPLIKRLRTRENYGSWKEVIALLKKELDWQMPNQQKSMLHTSCRIEPVKDYVQYMRFKKMRTVFFPQSMVELSAAVFFGQLSRESALMQAEELGYPEPPEVISELIQNLDISAGDILTSEDELKCVLEDCVP